MRKEIFVTATHSTRQEFTKAKQHILFATKTPLDVGGSFLEWEWVKMASSDVREGDSGQKQ
jgi:hypothetical protein